ncbi:Nucleotide-binding universal stress protein, UspA family [Halogranum amylolyticum]|uniref:Nucleotide-binding universal stress protein, UspA family n=1 Tax=Halogranum amylolyticum TaxID=660520 RepID=A0A1H8WJ90_9EURY|nr:universal stress protein [Halogranum amylolyticum]SEP27754.1 Nucleotide-binding universal stress protein, UspA family [Halogranum amylolyticum]
MYDQILFPTDGSAPTEPVFDYALQIAAEHEATLHVLNVVDTGRDGLAEVREEIVDELVGAGEEIVADAAQRAEERGVSVVSTVVRGDPSSSIVDYSDQSAVDLIVMPTHGRRGVERFLLGSVTERVINTAAIPVIAVDPEGDRPLTYPCQDLLVPTDGSRGAQLAVTEGIAVAEATGATLHLLHVVETGRFGSNARSVSEDGEPTERANEILADAVGTAEAASLVAVESATAYGVPAREILSYIEDNEVDLAVLGTHGETDFGRYMMGGVSAKIVRTSPVPVMWVREPVSDDSENPEPEPVDSDG